MLIVITLMSLLIHTRKSCPSLRSLRTRVQHANGRRGVGRSFEDFNFFRIVRFTPAFPTCEGRELTHHGVAMNRNRRT